MYRALYRKWRPQRFEDVVGQRAIVTALKNQITAGRVGHAYLFTGVRGTGKTTCAKIFAKAVNCLVADGCHLFGKAENSVIFREVDIEDGAEVRDSIIMQGSKIGACASIRYCILDKNVTIRPGTKLLGSIDHPLVVDKGDTV